MQNENTDSRPSPDGERPIFSSDRDVLPEGQSINPVAAGCLVMLAAKLGCLALILAFIFGTAMILRLLGMMN
jgi:hypothetical protein